MRTFALIAEGMTDVAVIEQIVEGTLGKDIVINPLMPLRDATDEARVQPGTFSTWELVLEYAASDEIQVALSTNDYLIIHIDTDQGAHPNFGLALHDAAGVIRPINDIVEDCRTLIKSKLPASIPSSWHARIVFAIPVLTTECWLIPLFDARHSHTGKTANNCEGRLSKINKGVVRKNYRSYGSAGKKFLKQPLLNDATKRTPCLCMFVSALQSISI